MANSTTFPSIANSTTFPSIPDEEVPPPGNLADELKHVGEHVFESPASDVWLTISAEEDTVEDQGHTRGSLEPSFRPDTLADTSQAADVKVPTLQATLPVATHDTPKSDKEIESGIPVAHLHIHEYDFDRPTLLAMRLHCLRQMYMLKESDKPHPFGDKRPLIRLVLHEPPTSRGLGWAAERGVVGDGADVDRAEPRYVTHFEGQPTLLFAEERSVISKVSERTILTVDEITPCPTNY
ncbi:hypothetical protein BC628DRAFT_63286 [Trametes gibbosa]|nr:hypothetical protein BC628DRAFT_63286 [Trametes gibbosa]